MCPAVTGPSADGKQYVKALERGADLSALQEEVRIMQMCQGHPNVVELLEVRSDAGALLFCMPRYDCDLLDFCFYNRLTACQVLQVLRPATSVLQWLHDDKQVVHIDIKPENICLRLLRGQPPQPVLIDFGHSQAGVPPGTRFGSQEFKECGTNGYRSPERVLLNTFCPREADWWGLGVSMLLAVAQGQTESVVMDDQQLLQEDLGIQLLALSAAPRHRSSLVFGLAAARLPTEELRRHTEEMLAVRPIRQALEALLAGNPPDHTWSEWFYVMLG